MISRDEFEEKLKTIDSDAGFTYGQKIVWKDGARWAFELIFEKKDQKKLIPDELKFDKIFDGNEMLGGES